MKSISEVLEDVTDVKKAFELGATRGACVGAGIVVVLVLLGAVVAVVWRGSPVSAAAAMVDPKPVPQKPFELSLVYNKVPFIGLSEAAVRSGLNKPATKQVIEREMATRWYFEQELLRSGTRYTPLLVDDGAVQHMITFTHGGMKRVAVQLLGSVGSPGRYGLIPFEEYEDDMRSVSQMRGAMCNQ